jgi:hypothetical protein
MADGSLESLQRKLIKSGVRHACAVAGARSNPPERSGDHGRRLEYKKLDQPEEFGDPDTKRHSTRRMSGGQTCLYSG